MPRMNAPSPTFIITTPRSPLASSSFAASRLRASPSGYDRGLSLVGGRARRLSSLSLSRHHPRREPSAVVAHAEICAGGRPQGRSVLQPESEASYGQQGHWLLAPFPHLPPVIRPHLRQCSQARLPPHRTIPPHDSMPLAPISFSYDSQVALDQRLHVRHDSLSHQTLLPPRSSA